MDSDVANWKEEYQALVKEKRRRWEAILQGIGRNEADLSEEEKKPLKLGEGLILYIKKTKTGKERKVCLTDYERNIVFYAYQEELKKLADYLSYKVCKDWGKYDDKICLSKIGFAAAWEYLECFDVLEKAQPHSFTTRRIYGAMVDHMKKTYGKNPQETQKCSLNNDESHKEVSVPPQLDQEIYSRELNEKLSQAISGLPTKHRESLVICLFMDEENLTYEETAARFNKKIGALKSDISRAKKMLRNEYPLLWDLLDKE